MASIVALVIAVNGIALITGSEGKRGRRIWRSGGFIIHVLPDVRRLKLEYRRVQGRLLTNENG
jgi:hypothetical protein